MVLKIANIATLVKGGREMIVYEVKSSSKKY